MPKQHIAVIGAGAFGTWTAYQLTKQGIQVSLIDAWGPGNIQAGSGGKTRIFRMSYGTDTLYLKMAMESIAFWKEFEGTRKASCFTRSGQLWLFSQKDDRYIRSSIPLSVEYGYRLEQWDEKELRKRYPQISAEGLETIYFEPEAGFLFADEACRQVTAAAVHMGAEYRQASVKPGKISAAGLEHLLLSDGSKLQADAYVFTCGAWLPGLFPDLLATDTHVSRMEVYFFGTPGGDRSYYHPQLPVWLEFGEETIHYGIPSDRHSGFKLGDDDRSFAFDPHKDDRLPTPDRLARAKVFMARRFPGLKNAPLLESRVCQYHNSPDGHFIIDRHPEAANLWICGGGTGHAFKLGPSIGKYACGRILGMQDEVAEFSLNRGGREKKYTQFD